LISDVLLTITAFIHHTRNRRSSVLHCNVGCSTPSSGYLYIYVAEHWCKNPLLHCHWSLDWFHCLRHWVKWRFR